MLSISLSSSAHVKKQDLSISHSLLQIIGGSLFIALCSQIKLVLPFTIVPLTLQTMAILLLGGLFGSKKASLMTLAYFGEILMGLPVLAGGTVNPLAFIGPNGGYLIGFLVQAYWMGWWSEKFSTISSKVSTLVGLSACCLQLGLGVCWLSRFVGWETVLMMGFIPFIPGEILKVLMTSTLLKKFR